MLIKSMPFTVTTPTSTLNPSLLSSLYIAFSMRCVFSIWRKLMSALRSPKSVK